MLKKSHRMGIALLNILLLSFITASPLLSKDIDFQFIEIEKVSRYFEDRIAFMHIQKDVSPIIDNSLASLLFIKDKKMYLIQDGYDNPKDVAIQRTILENENKLAEDLWTNKINSKPDYIRITERRVEVLKNTSEDFVAKNFGSFYTSVRNAFIQKHVNIFKQLMQDRKESGLVVERYPIPKPTYIGAPSEPQKYGIYVVGKTIDEKLYYAEDTDGDGITETFYVDIPDGFNWGYKSGPNILFIYHNKEDDIKQLIGSLTHDAYFGTPEEEKTIINTFPKDSDIINQFNLEKVISSPAK